MACSILVPWPGIQSGSWQWMCWILTAGPLANSLKLSLSIFLTITLSLSTLSLHPHSFPYNFAVPCLPPVPPPRQWSPPAPTWSDFYFDWASLVTQTVNGRRPGFDPWLRNIPWRRQWQPAPVFFPKKSHGQRSLVGYSPWVCKESDMTEQLTQLFWSGKSIFHQFKITNPLTKNRMKF